MKTAFLLTRAFLATAAMVPLLSSRAEALNVVNGGFNDLIGLTEQGGGWYQGVPAGWTSTANNPAYAVFTLASSGIATPPAANLGQLPVLRQNVGTTTSAGQVTLGFDLGAFGGTPNVTVRLTDGASVVYASGSYTTGSNRALSANIAGDRPVYIEFENTAGANPWLDNVSISTFAPSVVNGNFADTTGLTDMGGGWFAGLPAGWSTTESTLDAYAYSVRQIGTTNYANLDILGSNRGGFSPLRQSIGALEVASDIKVSFRATSLNGFPYIVGTAIYNAADDSLLATYTTPLVNGNTTVTYSALAIPAGTEVYVAFWTAGSLAPGITDVVIGVTGAATTLSMESASSVELDATSPVARAGNIVFQPGAKVSVTGNPAGSAVVLLSAGGSISGTPVLDPSVAGYTLGNTGKLLWLRPNGTSSLAAFNGDFSNLSGLTPAGETWYSGVPLGWTYANPANKTAYSVLYNTPGNWAANLSVLGVAYAGFYPLTQLVGTTQATGDVTLSFDVVKPVNTNRVAVGAALYNAADGSLLANIAIDSNTGPDSGPFSLTAVGVAAGTPIQIAFWSSLNPANAESFQSYPFLDNVTVSGGGAPPVYDTWALGYGLDPVGNGAPGADPDGDSLFNNTEFAFGTNPTVGNAALVQASTVAGQVRMSWLQRTGSPSAYTVLETTDLVVGPWVPSALQVLPGTGPTPPAGYEWKQISVSPGGKKFFRVRASL